MCVLQARYFTTEFQIFCFNDFLFQKMNNAINSVSSIKKVLCKKTVFKKKQSDVNTDDY